jgi:hypothetical protein
MVDELQLMMKDLKKKIKNRKDVVRPMDIEKIDVKKQKFELQNFLETYDLEIKKSDTEELYVQNMIKDFQGMKLSDIRFVVEKTYDKYNKMVVLINKYDDNFSEEEIKKYERKARILNDIFSFMVINHIGEYFNVEETY